MTPYINTFPTANYGEGNCPTIIEVRACTPVKHSARWWPWTGDVQISTWTDRGYRGMDWDTVSRGYYTQLEEFLKFAFQEIYALRGGTWDGDHRVKVISLKNIHSEVLKKQEAEIVQLLDQVVQGESKELVRLVRRVKGQEKIDGWNHIASAEKVARWVERMDPAEFVRIESNQRGIISPEELATFQA